MIKNMIRKHFVSMLVGLVLTTNIAIADPKEMPKYLNSRQFKQVVDDIHFLGHLYLGFLQFFNIPAIDRVITLITFDMEDFLNKPECESDSVFFTDNTVLLLKSTSESEFVWQEISYSDECDLQRRLNRLEVEEGSNWKPFPNSSSRIIQESEDWEPSITVVTTTDRSTRKVPRVETFETYLADCHEMKRLLVTVPITSLCVQKLLRLGRTIN